MKQTDTRTRCRALCSDLSYTAALSAGLLTWTCVLLRLWAAFLF